MAGIGFELRKLLRKDTYLGILQAYGYAGLISSGPWVLSILGVTMVGVVCISSQGSKDDLPIFWSSITYVIAGSLILTGFLQLLFTRFVADRIYEDREHVIVPNLIGALALTSIIAVLCGAPVVTWIPGSWVYKALMLSSFVATCEVWIVVVFVTGLKAYRSILTIFLGSYSGMVLVAYTLRHQGVEGLLTGFLTGHALLFLLLFSLVLYYYPARRAISFEFLSFKKSFYSLAFTGFVYNLGLWIDKLLFWSHPITSAEVLGPLRASALYDLPIFLAYLSVIPGMAVFIFRIETDFAENYERFYDGVRGGGTLQEIEELRNGMVFAVRQAIYEIFKVQGLTVAVLIAFGPPVLASFGVSPVHTRIFCVDVLGVGGLVLLLALLNVFFYLDYRGIALALATAFAIANAAATIVTIELGPSFYGFGFAVASIAIGLAGIVWLDRKLERLEYETFMLQR